MFIKKLPPFPDCQAARIFSPSQRKTASCCDRYHMITFWEWLEALSEERQKSVRPEKLRDYDLALRRHLIQMAKRIEDPAVRLKIHDVDRQPASRLRRTGPRLCRLCPGDVDPTQSSEEVRLFIAFSDCGAVMNLRFCGFRHHLLNNSCGKAVRLVSN